MTPRCLFMAHSPMVLRCCQDYSSLSMKTVVSRNDNYVQNGPYYLGRDTLLTVLTPFITPTTGIKTVNNEGIRRLLPWVLDIVSRTVDVVMRIMCEYRRHVSQRESWILLKYRKTLGWSTIYSAFVRIVRMDSGHHTDDQMHDRQTGSILYQLERKARSWPPESSLLSICERGRYNLQRGERSGE